VNLWSWLAVGVAAWTTFALVLAIGIGRILRVSRDLPAAGLLIRLHPNPGRWLRTGPLDQQRSDLA